ncbi:hypothetical protein M011DRAFT_480943 [Sporormia fimetaria CBS 119925]|uniref:Uncharacterized protein n=1 Tax=Sporormia fimetaria CBS 119925 TaxID=1340428 RepID=A0A6A6UYL3_9PLEO|nr:hypothetical protein M011DRAFT_480943 [Sporormia fimetaria CBS 119925]
MAITEPEIEASKGQTSSASAAPSSTTPPTTQGDNGKDTAETMPSPKKTVVRAHIDALGTGDVPRKFLIDSDVPWPGFTYLIQDPQNGLVVTVKDEVVIMARASGNDAD